ncbi:hypothetical protein TRFO_19497 [Tritrichomonas foetus]|uniref:Uncharacterized protein n=1 Tax=Tritrichomonas foetus TaxID=1144522 RepID=A0A1J4KIE5_9EUKA|nr:hypothetical protein TRFO_19497 [Tritrichomonas foetus]|eukprot:OHT11003.1 hypothetical protein TRFO_19497 [Tritrichomonas foetus]
MGRHKKNEIMGDEMKRSVANEKDIARILLGDFKPEGSRGLQLLRMVAPKDITRESLIALCKSLSFFSHIRLERNYTRRRDLLIKWCDDNYDSLLPFFEQLEFTFTE